MSPHRNRARAGEPVPSAYDSLARPFEVVSESQLAAIIERMHRLGSQSFAHRRRSVAMLFGTFLVLVPSLCTATVLAPGHHDGGAPGHHPAGMDMPAHAHWSSSEQAAEHHGAHACCAIAAHKPTREKGLAAPGAIATPALGAHTVVGPLAGPFRGRSSMEAPPGTPGLAATSGPLRR